MSIVNIGLLCDVAHPASEFHAKRRRTGSLPKLSVLVEWKTARHEILPKHEPFCICNHFASLHGAKK